MESKDTKDDKDIKDKYCQDRKRFLVLCVLVVLYVLVFLLENPHGDQD